MYVDKGESRLPTDDDTCFTATAVWRDTILHVLDNVLIDFINVHLSESSSSDKLYVLEGPRDFDSQNEEGFKMKLYNSLSNVTHFFLWKTVHYTGKNTGKTVHYTGKN